MRELAEDGVAALGLVERVRLDAVICDVRMGGMSGLDLLDRVKRTHPALPVVIITGAGGIEGAVDAMKRGASEYLDEAVRISTNSARSWRAPSRSGGGPGTQQGRKRRSSFSGGGEPSGADRQRACDAFPAGAHPSRGRLERTGGRHGRNGRRKGARCARHPRGWGLAAPSSFVAVNTSAIPNDLLESEIFGHVRGGFTGAIQSRKGLMAESDGGTLLLDEIGDMPADLQAKLSCVCSSSGTCVLWVAIGGARSTFA